MFSNNVSLTVVIHGNNGEHPAREFVSPIDRQTYVEGREGSNFTLRLRNSNNFRVLAIPSVDGLSVLDGKPAGDKSSGYILEANQTLDIPGWVVDRGTAAKFFFSGLKADGGDDSYAAQSGQDTRNKGFIGLKVFKEQYVYNGGGVFRTSSHTFGAAGGGVRGMATLASRSSFGGERMKGVSKGMVSPSVSSSIVDHSFVGSNSADFTATASAAGLESFGGSASMNNATMFSDMPDQERSRGIVPEVQQTLGTGFGEATDFATTKVDFKRGDLLSMMVIKYDDRRGLKKRGIEVDRPVQTQGSAFPADDAGCAPPAGWSRG